VSRVANQFDVLAVGGGPAGLAAAVRAAECGLQVGLVDDNPALGGQIWRGETGNAAAEASEWYVRLHAARVRVLYGTRVFHQPEPEILLAESLDGALELKYKKLVLATGARERFLPFPGWTLPNVMGAGGLQAMVKCGLPIAGKRVVVAGSGPLLLAVAAYLRQHGAEIPIICEQASWSSLASFGLALLRQPEKIRQGFSLRKQLAGIPFAASSWPLSARGQAAIEEVVISHGGKSTTIPCDYLACGFHLVPNSELAVLLGCRVRDDLVAVDTHQQTTVPGIYCAGEPTGIGGLELSLVEGQIAGLAAAGRGSAAQPLFAEREKLRRFARVLDRTFALRAELRDLPLPETIVCRCEDVTCSRLAQHTSWRAAKLQTRCGMGPCQARVCGPAAGFLFGWAQDSIRPPIFPTRFENLISFTPEAEHSEHRRPRMIWKGVMPAITTCFDEFLHVDHGFLAEHCRWLLDNGCSGVVGLGSLGEGATLSFEERVTVLRTVVKAVHGRGPAVASISALSTAEAVAQAKAAAEAGCDALMVLPPYVYQGDWREMKAHVSAVFAATPLSCMLYNNPVAYGTDFLPEQIQALAAEHENLAAVKESSMDVRRVAAIRALLGDRLAIFVGVDDAIVEAIAVGAIGWIAGLANALPRESVELFNYAISGQHEKAFELYRWFLPLLRLDTVPKFVQLIKLVQAEAGMGNARVRPPRLELTGEELQSAKQLIRDGLRTRPQTSSTVHSAK